MAIRDLHAADVQIKKGSFVETTLKRCSAGDNRALIGHARRRERVDIANYGRTVLRRFPPSDSRRPPPYLAQRQIVATGLPLERVTKLLLFCIATTSLVEDSLRDAN